MRRTQAALTALTLIAGVFMAPHHTGRSHDHVLAVASRTDHGFGMAVLDLPRKPQAVTRSHVRTALELHRVTTEKVRTPSRPQVRRPRYVRPHTALSFSGAAEQWAASAYVTRIRNCESSDVPTVVSTHAGVTYYGLYQMNADFWTTYGGDPSYLGNPFKAPRWLQNEVAYRGYQHRGYEPWSCA